MAQTETTEMSVRSLGTPIALGRTAEIYAWQDNQVLKLFYPLYPAHVAQHEVEIGRIISSMALPTPKMMGALEIEGRHGILYERVEGPSMLRLLTQKPWFLFQLGRQLAELQAEMHKQKGAGLPLLRPALLEGLQQVEGLTPDTTGDMLRLAETLPDGDALCHLDYHPDQVLMTAKGPVIIDWMTARQGHPLADVARTCILLSIGQVPYGSRVLHAIINFLRMQVYRTYIARYLELHPDVTQDDLKPWMVVAAATRLNERIPGEEESLVRVIRTYLPAYQPS